MSQRPDDGLNEILGADRGTVIIMLAVAAIFLPGMFAAFPARLGAWLITHGVLVPADQAVVGIPATGAGVDATRLWILALVAVALLAWSRARAHRRQRNAPTKERMR